MPTSKKYRPVDLRRVTRHSITGRSHRSTLEAFGRPIASSAGSGPFFNALPKFLKANDLKEFIKAVVRARAEGRPFHWLLGAHVIKVGLSPIIIDLMKRGVVTGLSFNGAGLIHDLELAFFGGTSEDVQAGLTEGSFGMVSETAKLFANVTHQAGIDDLGLGEACGRVILKNKAPHRNVSLFAAAARQGLPVTVHVGIGTDIVSQHPEFDPAASAAASHRDFRLLASICAELDRGGVAANIGSAVMLPEVFLKALTVSRNLNKGKHRLTTANFDMIEHYRPHVNVVTRPTFGTGKGYSFVGHHEIMIPLLAWGLKQKFAR